MLHSPSTVAGLVQQHGSSKVSTFSGSFDEPNKSPLKAFAATPHPAHRTRLLSQVHGVCFVDDTNCLRKLSCQQWVTSATGDQMIVGSLGDSVSQAFPVSIPGDSLDPKHFISLASVGIVNQMSLPHIPTSEHEPTQEPDPASITDSNRSIHWDAEDDQGLPVFSAFMTVFPLLEGVDLPLDGFDLSGPLPNPWPAGTPDEFIAWVRAVKYLIDHNNGRSLHFDPTMFRASSVPVDKFGGELSLVSSPTIPFTTLNIASPPHQAALKKFHADREVAYLRAARSTEVGDEVGPAAGIAQTVGHTLFADSLRELVENPRMTGSERERHLHQKEVSSRYRILFAHRNETTNEMEPATLSPNFSAALLRSNRSLAVEDFQKHIQEYIENKRAKDPFNTVYQLASNSFSAFNHASIGALQGFRWMHRGWLEAVDHMGTHLSVLHFLPNPVKSRAYKEYKARTDRILFAEAMDEDKSKVEAKQRELFYGGSIATCQDLLSCICAFRVFVEFAVSNFDEKPPLFNTVLENLLHAVQSTTGQAWMTKHAEVRHLALALAADFQTMLLPFVNIANNTTLLSDLTNGGTLPVSPYDGARRIALQILDRAMSCMTTGNLGQYCEVPELASIMNTGSATLSSGRPAPGGASPAGKKPKLNKQQESSSKPAGQGSKDTGWLIWSKSTSPPFLDVSHKHPRHPGVAKLCTFYLFQGRHCKNGDQCLRIHPKSLSSLPPEKQNEVKAFVANTDGVSWAPGHNPNNANQVGFSIPSLPIPAQDPESFHDLRYRRGRSSSGLDSGRAAIGEPTLPPSDGKFQDSVDDGMAPLPPASLESSTAVPSSNRGWTRRQREDWARAHLPTPVLLQLDTAHGKDSLAHSFYGEICFRHIGIFLLPSGFLSPSDFASLLSAYPRFERLQRLIVDSRGVDFRPLQSPIPAELSDSQMMRQWSRMFTACLLHYKLDIASAVRFCGGIHTGSHRDWPTIHAILSQANVNPTVIRDLGRVFVAGCPGHVNVTSTDSNFRDFLAYGNHATVLEDVSATKAAFSKDIRRSYALPAHPELLFFMRHIHLSPLGMVLPTQPDKKARPIVDCSFRPQLHSFAVNDWTSTDTEPEITFPGSFLAHLTWIYNLRISYPKCEIYPMDDDISGAFRHCKFNPNVVGMHAFLLFGAVFFSTGQVFGGNTCPANFEPVARAREELARFLWYQEDTVRRVQQFLPTLPSPQRPTAEDCRLFTPAEADSLNRGAFTPNGSRMAPPFKHHVDDNLYAEVEEFLIPTLAASILALYLILGFPSSGNRDVVSWEKFLTSLGHRRRCLGWMLDTRRLAVELPDDKREQLLRLLNLALDHQKCTLHELAVLLGHLETCTRVCRWMRPRFFHIQSLLRTLLRQRYEQVRFYKSRHDRADVIRARLPPSLSHRLESIVSREIAQHLWQWKQSFTLPAEVLQELGAVRESLHHEVWAIYIPQMIPRDSHFESAGDASLLAGGGFSTSLRFWFVVIWGDRIRAGVRLSSSAADYVHINCLEFLVVFLQVAATVVRLENAVPDDLVSGFPNGFPAFPVLHSETDNTPTKRWTNRVATSSSNARPLLDLYGQLLRRSTITVDGEWRADVSKISVDSTLQLFPAECRASLRSGVVSVRQTMGGPPKASKELGTIRSRRLHYLLFCHSLSLTDDWLLVHVSQERRVWQLALYAVHLASGNGLYCQQLKATTIQAYLRAVATFLRRFCTVDPRFLRPTDQKIAPPIRHVLDEVRRHEQVPNKCEPFTLSMLALLDEWAASEKQPDGLYAALADWCNNNLYQGCRLSEWAQISTRSSINQPPAVDWAGVPLAFCLSDLAFQTASGRQLLLRDVLDRPHDCGRVLVRWSHQKNGNHGEKRLFVRNQTNPARCFVAHLISIVRRFQTLVGLHQLNLPLAVYCHPTKGVLYLTEADITSTFRALATEVYSLDLTTTDSKFSSHSLRVGACVLLHAQGFTPIQIKFLLRWKSDAFMEYLRNVALLSSQQNLAVNYIDQMPNLI